MAGICFDVGPCVRLTNNEIMLGSAVSLNRMHCHRDSQDDFTT